MSQLKEMLSPQAYRCEDTWESCGVLRLELCSCLVSLQGLVAGETGTCQKQFGKTQPCLRAAGGLMTPRCPVHPHLIDGKL